jgi:mRNA-degrading endonuclease RelE of RelBE toxin-antitoxin system
MVNKIVETDYFSKIFNKLNKREQNWINKIVSQLEQNLEVGKPLGFIWFREKKFGSMRLYYLVNFEAKVVVLHSFGNKKDQQQTIDRIIKNKKNSLNLLNSFNV